MQKIKYNKLIIRLLRGGGRILSDNILTIIGIILILTIPQLLNLNIFNESPSYIYGLRYLLLWTLCFNFVISYLLVVAQYIYIYKIPIGKILYSIGLCFIFLLSITNIFLFYSFSAELHSYILQLISETNPQESGEFISTYIFSEKTLYTISWIGGVLILLFVLSIITKEIRKKKLYKKLLVYICLPVLAYSTYVFVCNLKYFSSAYTYNYRECRIGHNPIFLLVNAIWQFCREQPQFEICGEYCCKVEEVTCTDSIPTIVLVIGESFNKYHSSLYGYNLNTNPRLSHLENTYIFSDVISYCNSTSVCFKHFMSCLSTDSKEEWCYAPLFPAVFRKAGYNVNFWSNQYIHDIKMDGWDASAAFFNKDNISFSCFDNRNKEKFQYDGELIDDYKKQKCRLESTTNNLIIFHLYGQHFEPKKRFPNSASHFTTNDYPFKKGLSQFEKQEIADYDNATLYNDSIVSEIINMYEDKDAIIIYFADHGEEAHDFRKHVGRSFDFKEIGADVFHNQLDIPFIIHVTNSFKNKHKYVVSQISQSVAKSFMTDDISHLLFDLAGIKTKWFNPERSIINSEFNSSRKRNILNRNTQELYDYDSYCPSFIHQ